MLSGQRTSRAMLWAAVGLLVATSGCAVWRIGDSVAMARQSRAFEQRPADAALRLLVVGDSTAVGTGATAPAASVAGRLGQAHPNLWIDNRAQDGARLADVEAQLRGADERFDIVLVQAGGNDIIRLSNLDTLRKTINDVARVAGEKAPLVLLMPAGNVGNSPFFFPPLRGWMTQRSRDLHAIVRETAASHGAVYVNLFKERADDPFVHNPALHASDGLHPSDAGYGVWLEELMGQSALASTLKAAR